jgi:Trp operon repressor
MTNGELTELERVRLENFMLRHNSIQRELQTNLAARAAFIQEVEAAHPGYRWDEGAGLVPQVE